MFKSEDDFKKLISGLNIDNEPNTAHRKNLRRQIFLAFNQTTKKQRPSLQTWLKTSMKSKITKPAVAAAVIIIAVGFLVVQDGPIEQAPDQTKVQIIESPIKMITALSLNLAYRQGGMAALEAQCDRADELLGPRPNGSTVWELLEEFNGKSLKGKNYENN